MNKNLIFLAWLPLVWAFISPDQAKIYIEMAQDNWGLLSIVLVCSLWGVRELYKFWREEV